MKKVNDLNRKIYLFIRIIASFTAILLLFVNIWLIIKDYQYDKTLLGKLYSNYKIINAVMLEIFIVYLIIFPYKFESIAICSFLYTASILYFNPLNQLSVVTYFLGIVSLYFRGLLKTKKTLKMIFLSTGYIIILFSNFRYGFNFFLEDLVEKISFSIVCSIIFCFIILGKNMARTNNLALDLNQYPDLTERDKEWIEMALSQEKYETIARKYKLSVNYVKNRMRIIYKILRVADRLSLISTYSGWTVKK